MKISQELIEKVVLLILAAVLTGFLLPYEASLARQSKIIDAQVQLLESLASLLWEYQLLAIEVSYFHPIEQMALYSAASEQYEQKTSTTFAKIRAEISKALHLTSAETYENLKQLYYEQLLPLDVSLSRLMREQLSATVRVAGWGDFNKYAVYTLADIIDGTLDKLAGELRLKGGVVDHNSP
jgi:type II secretory pathway pseudopilin PulG